LGKKWGRIDKYQKMLLWSESSNSEFEILSEKAKVVGDVAFWQVIRP
jgi:hypothetical protein